MSLLYGAKSSCAGRGSFLCISDDFSRIKFRSLNPESGILESEEWNDENSKREKEKLILRQSNETLDFSCMGQFLLYDQRFFLSIIYVLEISIVLGLSYLRTSLFRRISRLISWASIGRRLKLGTLRFWAVVIIYAVLSCRRSRVEYKANGNIESERFLL